MKVFVRFPWLVAIFLLLVLFVMVDVHQRMGAQVPTGQPHAE